MGGSGSGWPTWKFRRATTESSLALDVRSLSKSHSHFTRRCHSVHTWRHPATREPIASVAVRIDSDQEHHPSVVLACRNEAKCAVATVIELDKTIPFFGGIRWWFVCPSCKRRAAKIYLPFRDDRFLCRHCHGLTYQSCQDSHRFDKLFFAIAGDQGNAARKALTKRFSSKASHSSQSIFTDS